MYSILFENNVTIIHLAKELTMKKYFKFVSSILTATILISILYPNMALAKTSLTQDNTTTPYYDNILSSPQKNLFKNITYDNLTMTIEDKFLKENSGTIYRKSEQEYLINLGEIKSSENISLLNNSLVISYASDESGTNTKNKTDDSISVKITLTVDYRISNNTVKMSKITSKLIACNGSTTSNVGSGVFIIGNELTYGQVDAGHSSQKTTVALPTNACTRTYSPTNWKAVSTSAGIVGATQIVTLRGRNSKWSVTLTNNIIDSMP